MSLNEATFIPVWPLGIRLAPFNASRQAVACHHLLETSYREGQGDVPPFQTWWESIESDPEYDPATMFVALDTAGNPGAFAHCWSSSFLKDLAVADHWRRQGLGTAMLMEAFSCFRKRGFASFDLKVRAGNHPAMHFYSVIGMRLVDTLPKE